MTQAPPLTVPPFQAVSGSYRMRHPYASAREPEGASVMLAQDEGLTAPLRIVSQPDGTSPAARLPRPGTVKARLTAKRPRRQVENDEYGAFVRRILRAYSRRVGDGDVEALVLLAGLAQAIVAAMAEAGNVPHDHDHTWAVFLTLLSTHLQP